MRGVFYEFHLNVCEVVHDFNPAQHSADSWLANSFSWSCAIGKCCVRCIHKYNVGNRGLVLLVACRVKVLEPSKTAFDETFSSLRSQSRMVIRNPSLQSSDWSKTIKSGPDNWIMHPIFGWRICASQEWTIYRDIGMTNEAVWTNIRSAI